MQKDQNVSTPAAAVAAAHISGFPFHSIPYLHGSHQLDFI